MAAANYDLEYEQYTKDTHPFVLREVNKVAFTSILDVSCGTGTILSMISGDIKKTGVDLSPKMIHMAKKSSAIAPIWSSATQRCFLASTDQLIW